MKKFRLGQNYPNPFNPVTKIDFDIPMNSKISLIVYDVSGREIKKLVNEIKEAGYYSVNFDGTNLASGVYLYKLEAGSFLKQNG
ncbi:MAG: T9SS type A sorting domain-containing protein [Ignavibacteria bacterium]|nr:T9SS type A sorting domain-containing protein [Ignavibacteria bacterium]